MAWPTYGRNKRIYNITDGFEAAIMPLELRERCDLLNRVVLEPANGA